MEMFSDNSSEYKQKAPMQNVTTPRPMALEDNRARTVIQKKINKTGLPDQLKSGIENLSGHSMDDVKVHYNSDKPAQLQAHAYARGNQIHVAPGQEKHLPHEAWHVVQQKQGRVKPTLQMKGIVNINDDAGLEKEADAMGAKANFNPIRVAMAGTANFSSLPQYLHNKQHAVSKSPTNIVQRVLNQQQLTALINFINAKDSKGFSGKFRSIDPGKDEWISCKQTFESAEHFISIGNQAEAEYLLNTSSDLRFPTSHMAHHIGNSWVVHPTADDTVTYGTQLTAGGHPRWLKHTSHDINRAQHVSEGLTTLDKQDRAIEYSTRVWAQPPFAQNSVVALDVNNPIHRAAHMQREENKRRHSNYQAGVQQPYDAPWQPITRPQLTRAVSAERILPPIGGNQAAAAQQPAVQQPAANVMVQQQPQSYFDLGQQQVQQPPQFHFDLGQQQAHQQPQFDFDLGQQQVQQPPQFHFDLGRQQQAHQPPQFDFGFGQQQMPQQQPPQFDYVMGQQQVPQHQPPQFDFGFGQQQAPQHQPPQFDFGFGQQQVPQQQPPQFDFGFGQQQAPQQQPPQFDYVMGQQQVPQHQPPQFHSGYGQQQAPQHQPPQFDFGFGQQQVQQPPQFHSGYGQQQVPQHQLPQFDFGFGQQQAPQQQPPQFDYVMGQQQVPQHQPQFDYIMGQQQVPQHQPPQFDYVMGQQQVPQHQPPQFDFDLGQQQAHQPPQFHSGYGQQQASQHQPPQFDYVMGQQQVPQHQPPQFQFDLGLQQAHQPPQFHSGFGHHWGGHVIQQKRDDSKPILQLKANVNNDKVLEKEADVMGAIAAQQLYGNSGHRNLQTVNHHTGSIAQLVKKEELGEDRLALVESEEFKQFIKLDGIFKPFDTWLSEIGLLRLDKHIANFKKKTMAASTAAKSLGPAKKTGSPSMTNAKVAVGVTKSTTVSSRSSSVSATQTAKKSLGTVPTKALAGAAAKAVAAQPAPRPIFPYLDLIDRNGNPTQLMGRLTIAYRADLGSSRMHLTEAEGNIIGRNLNIAVRIVRGAIPQGYRAVPNAGGGDCLIHSLIQAQTYINDQAAPLNNASEGQIGALRTHLRDTLPDDDIINLISADFSMWLSGINLGQLGPAMRAVFRSLPNNLVRPVAASSAPAKKEASGSKPAEQVVLERKTDAPATGGIVIGSALSPPVVLVDGSAVRKAASESPKAADSQAPAMEGAVVVSNSSLLVATTSSTLNKEVGKEKIIEAQVGDSVASVKSTAQAPVAQAPQAVEMFVIGAGQSRDDIFLYHDGINHWQLIRRVAVAGGGAQPAAAESVTKEGADEAKGDPFNTTALLIRTIIKEVQVRLNLSKGNNPVLEAILQSILKRWEDYKLQKDPKISYYYTAFFSGEDMGLGIKSNSLQWAATRPLVTGLKDIPKSYGPLALSYTKSVVVQASAAKSYTIHADFHIQPQKGDIALVIAETVTGKKANKTDKKAIKTVGDLEGTETATRNKKKKSPAHLDELIPEGVPVVSKEEADEEWRIMAKARKQVDPEQAASRNEFAPNMVPISLSSLKENDIFCAIEKNKGNKAQKYYGVKTEAGLKKMNPAGNAFVNLGIVSKVYNFFLVSHSEKPVVVSKFLSLLSANSAFISSTEQLIRDLSEIYVTLTSRKKDVPKTKSYNLGQLFSKSSAGITIADHTKRVLWIYEKIDPLIARTILSKDEFRLLISLHDIGKGMGEAAGDKTSKNQHSYTNEVIEEIQSDPAKRARTGVTPEKMELIKHTINMDPIGEMLRSRGKGVDDTLVTKAAKTIIAAYSEIQKNNSKLSLENYFNHVLIPFYIADSASYTSHGDYDLKNKQKELSWASELYPKGKFDAVNTMSLPIMVELKKELEKNENWRLASASS